MNISLFFLQKNLFIWGHDLGMRIIKYWKSTRWMPLFFAPFFPFLILPLFCLYPRVSLLWLFLVPLHHKDSVCFLQRKLYYPYLFAWSLQIQPLVRCTSLIRFLHMESFVWIKIGRKSISRIQLSLFLAKCEMCYKNWPSATCHLQKLFFCFYIQSIILKLLSIFANKRNN